MQMDLCHIVAVAAFVNLRGHNAIYENLEYILYVVNLWLAVDFLKKQP